MKTGLILISIIFFYSGLSAQDEFQQDLSYKIDASWSDETEKLSATYELSYTNNSTEELSFILFHVWANAYSNRETEFARQLADQGDRHFYFADEKDLGGYTGLVFKIDNKQVEYRSFEGHADIIKLMLPKPLKPGDSLNINSQYVIDVPANFSRMGKQERSLQLTQWYPKPAVFDNEGWHPMPYLNMGEFFSEFADYEVSIELPSDYIVAATGELLTESERDQYISMSKGAANYVPNGKIKKLKYKASKVHDFAMFLDKDFLIDHSVSFINGNEIDCWSFFHSASSAWSASNDYVRRAVEYASDHIGPYPYPQVTAVEGNLVAGGGMEYPMVTVIDPMESSSDLDRIIAHEVFHNWFYGILASNERDYPWMDEGFTSYYEHRYMRHYYDGHGDVMADVATFFKTDDLERALYSFQEGRALTPRTCCSCRHHSPVNYQLVAYTKPRMGLEHLESIYGTEELDEVVQSYFEKWSFNHPGPDDIQNIFEEKLKSDLDWLFVDWMQSNKVCDYKVSFWNGGSIKIKNKGQISAPLRLKGYSSGGLILDTTLSGFENQIEISIAQELDYLDATHDGLSIDVDKTNNHVKRGGWPLRKSKGLTMRPDLDFSQDKLYMYPMLGWNNYDGFMLGIHLANRTAQPKVFNLSVTPLFGFHSDLWVGQGDIHWNIVRRSGRLRMLQLGSEFKRYSTFIGENENRNLASKVAPYLSFNWRGNEAKYGSHRLLIKWDWLNEDMEAGDTGGVSSKSNLKRLSAIYNWKENGGIHPWRLKSSLEWGQFSNNSFMADQDYGLLTVDFRKKIYYSERNKIRFRFYGAAFIFNSDRESGSVLPPTTRRTLGLTYQGYNDLFDHTLFGRSEADGWMAHQIFNEEGGFKAAIPRSFANVIGNSNDAIFSLNVSSDIPGNIPIVRQIMPFLDVGYFSDKQPSHDVELKDQLLWSAGLSLIVVEDILEIHFPLFQSQSITDVFEQSGQSNFWRKTTFMIDLKALNLYDLSEHSPLKF